MKIIFDISLLGTGYYIPTIRTGLFRVVENTAYSLVDSEECNLEFCAIEGYVDIENLTVLEACLDYINSNTRLKGVPFPYSKLKNLIYKKLRELNTKITNVSEFQRLLLKVIIKPLHYTYKAINPYSLCSSLDPKTLAEADIFHSPFLAIPQPAREVRSLKKFLTVYDLIPILYPQFFEFDEKDGPYLQKVLNSLCPEDWVLCISYSTKNDLCNYRKDIDPSKVLVTHLAASNIFHQCFDSQQIIVTRHKYNIPDGSYILSLCTLEPRKNLPHLIRCFAKLVQEQNLKDLYLVLVGPTGWKSSKIFEEISNHNFLKDRIILTGFIADEDLAAIYSGALAFVYPSFYEGFGLPPLEAMQCGVPVITSNTSSLPEVVGDAGIMLAPLDADGLCHNLFEIYRNSYLRETMSSKSLEQAKKFSWENYTQKTIAAYKTAL